MAFSAAERFVELMIKQNRSMNGIIKSTANLLLTVAAAAVAVSCLKSGGFNSSYQAMVTLEEFAETSSGAAYGEDKALFEIGYAFLVDNNITFSNSVDDKENPTDYTGFALSYSTLEKSSSDGSDENAESAESGSETPEQEETAGGNDGAGADDGYNRFTVNAESASSGSVFAVFHNNPEISANGHHIQFISGNYGTCTPVGCVVNNTKQVADWIAEYNAANDVQVEVKLTATGYLSGAETESASILLAGVCKDEETETTGYSIMDKWTVFDLSELGNIEYIDFKITATPSIAAVPEYFCIDDFVANVNISIASE